MVLFRDDDIAERPGCFSVVVEYLLIHSLGVVLIVQGEQQTLRFPQLEGTGVSGGVASRALI